MTEDLSWALWCKVLPSSLRGDAMTDTDELVTFDEVKGPFGWMGNMSPYPVRYKEKWFATAEHLFQFMRFLGMKPVVFQDSDGKDAVIDEEFMKEKLCASRFDCVSDELAAARRGVTEKVRPIANPLIAKNVAKKYLKFVRDYSDRSGDDLEAAYAADLVKDVENMRFILRQKVAFNSELIRSLLATGNARIVEDVTNRVANREERARQKVLTCRMKCEEVRLKGGKQSAIDKAERELISAEEAARNPNHRHDLFWGQVLMDGQWVGENQLGRAWMELRDRLREVLDIPVKTN